MEWGQPPFFYLLRLKTLGILRRISIHPANGGIQFPARIQILISFGEGEIRTREDITALQLFESCGFNHSPTSPQYSSFGILPNALLGFKRAVQNNRARDQKPKKHCE